MALSLSLHGPAELRPEQLDVPTTLVLRSLAAWNKQLRCASLQDLVNGVKVLNCTPKRLTK